MKEYLKNTWFMYITIFVFCFMLFLYEPLMMYLGNISDFWFDINTMFKMSLLLFLIVFIIVAFVFNIIYFLSKKNSKKTFKVCTIIMFVIFFCSYIQGNYLVGNLPVLDGSKIVWSSYKVDWIISIVLWLIVIGLVIFIVKKVTINKTVKYTGFVSLAVFLMLSLSLSTTIFTTKELKEKDFVPLVTYKDINKYSTNKNFVILLLDCVDSKAFINRLNVDNEFKNILNDFTYYQDMMSGHPLTTESIPLILTGKYYQNDGPIVEWSTDAYKNSYLFELVEKNNYELDVYEQDILYNDKSATRINNIYDIREANSIISKYRFWKQELKYILFRYLPSPLKRFSKIDEMHFSMQYISDNSMVEDRFYDSSNYAMLEIIREDSIVKVDDNVFKFIHVNGAHAPYMYNKDYQSISNATYNDAIDSSLTLTKEYLDMLKKNGVYDDSIIIIMADHGFSTKENGMQRRNPIFFIKGVNDFNKTMKVSDKPVHFVDLLQLYDDLFAGKKTSEIFSNVPNNRTRRFVDYEGGSISNETMVEYKTNGKSWDNSKLYATGEKYYKKW